MFRPTSDQGNGVVSVLDYPSSRPVKSLSLSLCSFNGVTVELKILEASRKAIEEAPPVTKETTVIVQDTQKIDSLTVVIDKLKVR